MCPRWAARVVAGRLTVHLRFRGAEMECLSEIEMDTYPDYGKKTLQVVDWGLQPYGDAVSRQKDLVAQRIAGRISDRLVLVEHFPVVTIGGSGGYADLLESAGFFAQKRVEICRSERGGKVTYHGPGQMVAYPIVHLRGKDLHVYVRTLLRSVMDVLEEYGLKPALKEGEPGIWVAGCKIASIGVAAKKWVTYHGIALNVNTDLTPFSWIVPCGKPSEHLTSMKEQLGREIDLEAVKKSFIRRFRTLFGYPEEAGKRLPGWLKVPGPDQPAVERMERMLDSERLGTVCQSAHCPNLGECFGRGTATFMIMGGNCTRRCRFCAILKGSPEPLDSEEPERVALAAKRLGLHHVVVTSVTRDDLPDGGAGHFARTVECIRRELPGAAVEILIPDFNGNSLSLERVFQSGPDVLNHNIETVSRLYSKVRPQAVYRRSLEVLEQAAAFGLRTKSGLMLGLGESPEEVRQTLFDLREAGCEYLTIGQYLAPSVDHVAVERYLPPSEFVAWADAARAMGFSDVVAGPLVRSSYHAERMGGISAPLCGTVEH